MIVMGIIQMGVITIQDTTQMSFTTRPTPTRNYEQVMEEWMSPNRRNEHKSEYIESVIFEPQPRMLMSRSTYKVTSFIDFAPYRETFKKFERFLNRFRKDLHDPERVGPLFNINRTKTSMWQGPKADAFRGQKCRKEAYKCRLSRQFSLIRMECAKTTKLFQGIYAKFIMAIDSMEHHSTSGRRETSKGTRVKRGVRIQYPTKTNYQLAPLAFEDEQTLSDIEYFLRVKMLKKQRYSRRRKRFLISSIILGWKIHQNKKLIESIKKSLKELYEQNTLQQNQILEMARFLNITYGYVSENRLSINQLQVHLAMINKTLLEVMKEVKFIKFTIAIITDARTAMSRLTLGLITLQENVKAIYEYMRVLATYRINSVMLPPHLLRGILERTREDMKRNPRLRLPEDPDKNIWKYYEIIRVQPIVMENFLAIILTLPIIDTSLQMNVYKVHNLPTLHPELKIQFTYQLEGEYLAISKDGIYAAIPAKADITICQATNGYICMMNQALYPIEKIEWCIYALYEGNYDKIGEFCIINTKERHVNMAQSLDGYMWAISPLQTEKIQIRCLTRTTIEMIKPPLTMLYVGNGCEAYSTNIFIPAKSELTSHDPELTRHVFFLRFNEEYQNLTKYSMIHDLHFEQLTQQEKENLPNRLTALPPLKFNHLKKRINPLTQIRPPFKVHPNIVLIILLIAILLIVLSLGFLVWHIYKVRSRVKGFKPMAKLFTSNVDNLEESVTQLLALIKNPVSHLTKTFMLSTPAMGDQPHESGVSPKPIRKPRPPPREENLPPEEIELIRQVAISEETLNEVAQDLKKAEPRKYKGYIKKLRQVTMEQKEDQQDMI